MGREHQQRPVRIDVEDVGDLDRLARPLRSDPGELDRGIGAAHARRLEAQALDDAVIDLGEGLAALAIDARHMGARKVRLQAFKLSFAEPIVIRDRQFLLPA